MLTFGNLERAFHPRYHSGGLIDGKARDRPCRGPSRAMKTVVSIQLTVYHAFARFMNPLAG